MISASIERRQQEECSSIKAIGTPFNADTRIPPFYGLMFEAFPRVDLELLTIELDVRIPEGESVDLTVEVYTMVGSFELLNAYGEGRWTKLAEAEMILLPRGKAIIPTSVFTALPIEAKQRHSFYITMKGPYIDHNAMALQKTGELQMRTPELDLFVGVGYNDYKFSGDFDKNLDPQFAGVLHFRKTQNCDAAGAIIQTVVEYHYIVDTERTSQLMLSLNDVVQEAVEKLMASDDTVQLYKEQYGLTISNTAQTGKRDYDGSCPAHWELCPDYYLRTLVTFSHEEKLTEGHVHYAFFRGIEESIATVAAERLMERKIKYTGFSSASAKITLDLHGISRGERLDNVQLDYLADAALEFLDEETADNFAFFSMDIGKQSIEQLRERLRHARVLEEDVVRVDATILGAFETVYDAETFRAAIENTLRDRADNLMEKLRMNGLRPSEITEEGRIEYFNSITGIGGNVKVDKVPQASARLPDDENDDFGGMNPLTDISPENKDTVKMAVGAAIGGLIALVALFFFRQWCKRVQHRRDRQRMKKKREKADLVKAEQSPDRKSAITEKLSDEMRGYDESQELQLLTPQEVAKGIPEGGNVKNSRANRPSGPPVRSKSFDDSYQPSGVSFMSPGAPPRYGQPPTPSSDPTGRRGPATRSRSFDDRCAPPALRGGRRPSPYDASSPDGTPVRSKSLDGSCESASAARESFLSPGVPPCGGRRGPPPSPFRRSGPPMRSKSFDDATGPPRRGYPPESPGGRGYARALPGGRGYAMASPSGGRGFISPGGKGFMSPCGRGIVQASPSGRGYAYTSPGGRGYSPGGQGYTPGGRGYSPGGRGYSPGGRGYSPGGRGYSPGGRGYSSGGRSYCSPMHSSSAHARLGFPGYPSAGPYRSPMDSSSAHARLNAPSRASPGPYRSPAESTSSHARLSVPPPSPAAGRGGRGPPMRTHSDQQHVAQRPLHSRRGPSLLSSSAHTARSQSLDNAGAPSEERYCPQNRTWVKPSDDDDDDDDSLDGSEHSFIDGELGPNADISDEE